ncbi:MAG: hypothetical protein V1752_06445 [Candidatus Firestonebacteria bacterium]
MEKNIKWYKEDGKIIVVFGKNTELVYDEKDRLQLSLGVSQLYKSGVGSSRELGEIFGCSGVTVLRKEKRVSDKGVSGLIDGREANGKESKLSMKDKVQILHLTIQDFGKKRKEILSEVNAGRLGKEKISIKTLNRYYSESGLGLLQVEHRRKQGSPSGKTEEVESKKTVEIGSRYAGTYLGYPVLGRLGYQEVLKRVKETSPGLRSEEQLCYSIEELFFLLYCLYAESRRRRVYDLGTVAHEEYAGLIGKRRHILASGCWKRLKELICEMAIGEFEEAASDGIVKSRIIVEVKPGREEYGEKALEVFYADSHVSEVHRKENISMALHGTKRRKVQAVNKNYIVSAKGIPVVRSIVEGKRRLSQELSDLVLWLKKYFPGAVVSFDKGGVSKKVLNTFIKEGMKFVCWMSKWKSVKEKIEKIPMKKYNVERKEETKSRSGKVIRKIVERLCETKLEYKEVGLLRTVVVYFQNTQEKAWLCTNLTKKECGTLGLREIIRFKQYVENFFKQRKCYGSLDCFGGGEAMRKKIEKPTMKTIEAKIKRTDHLLYETRGALQDLSMGHSSKLIADSAFRLGQKFFTGRINELEEKLEKLKAIRSWLLGGKKPEFIQAPYELDLKKERILTQFQDWAYIVKNELTREYKECYKKVLLESGLDMKVTTEKLNNLDDTKVYRELTTLGGRLDWNHVEGILTVKLNPLMNKLEQQALVLLCRDKSKQNTEIDFGKGRKYIVKFTTC